ncbi:MAG: cytochrome c-type biogenesis protein CcmH [Halieaceae bacterium]|jgi:cytochrome c-type biogenesis protein CcmH|nr:cytochrome c-type biogenesis protein CcmH [Halieaceae bacterium]
MISLIRLAFLVLALTASMAGQAVIETYEFSSTALERRYHQLSTELRCPKCQNQNIADSNAPIAQDLRKLLFQLLESGATNDEILSHMVSRYGEFVRYRPRLTGATSLLWIAPVLLLLGAVTIVYISLRRRKGAAPETVELSAQEQKTLKDMLEKVERDR